MESKQDFREQVRTWSRRPILGVINISRPDRDIYCSGFKNTEFFVNLRIKFLRLNDY